MVEVLRQFFGARRMLLAVAGVLSSSVEGELPSQGRAVHHDDVRLELDLAGAVQPANQLSEIPLKYLLILLKFASRLMYTALTLDIHFLSFSFSLSLSTSLVSFILFFYIVTAFGTRRCQPLLIVNFLPVRSFRKAKKK